MNFRKFGWNGFLLELPEKMRFASQSGNANDGNFMLETESYFLEGKWEPIPKKPKSLSVVAASLVEQQQKQIEKQFKKRFRKKMKKLATPKVKILVKEQSTVFSHESLFVLAKSNIEERYYLWYCKESNRLIIFRFVFQTFEETSKKILKQIMENVECHRKTTYVWSLMDLLFEAPVEYLLTSAKITVGKAHIILEKNKLSMFAEKSSSILIGYFSMANLIYKDTYRNLDKWFERNHYKDLRKLLKKRRLKLEDSEPRKVRRHNAVVKRALSKSGVSWRSTSAYTNTTWYCSGSNRIYNTTIIHTLKRPLFFKRNVNEDGNKELSNRILSSIKCHK